MLGDVLLYDYKAIDYLFEHNVFDFAQRYKVNKCKRKPTYDVESKVSDVRIANYQKLKTENIIRRQESKYPLNSGFWIYVG